MAVLLERRSGEDRRQCTLPAIMALGWERRWHRERRRADPHIDDAFGQDDDSSDASWRDNHEPDARSANHGEG